MSANPAFSGIRRYGCGLLALLLCCLPLAGCQSAADDGAMEGIRTTQLAEDRNRRVAEDLSAEITGITCWQAMGAHVMACGYAAQEQADDRPLLIDFDPDAETYAYMQLTLPQDAPAADDGDNTLVSRAISGILRDTATQQLRLLLDDSVRQPQEDGRLPSVWPMVRVHTVVGDGDLVGPEPGWTLEEFFDFSARHPQRTPLCGWDRETFLYQLGQCDSALIDFENAQAHLETPLFAQLLQAGAAYPAERPAGIPDPTQQTWQGVGVLTDTVVDEWQDAVVFRYIFGDSYVCKGYPGDGGNGGNTLYVGFGLGICADCQDPDGAWQLLRQFLLPEFQDRIGGEIRGGFPIRRDSLQASATAAQHPVLRRTILPDFISDEALEAAPELLEFFSQPPTEEDVDRLMQLIEQAHPRQYSSIISDILVEEAAACYSGQCTAAQAAAIMQDRVQTYLAEQADD